MMMESYREVYCALNKCKMKITKYIFEVRIQNYFFSKSHSTWLIEYVVQQIREKRLLIWSKLKLCLMQSLFWYSIMICPHRGNWSECAIYCLNPQEVTVTSQERNRKIWYSWEIYVSLKRCVLTSGSWH